MDAHLRESASAQAAMAEFYGKRWTPRIGDRVRCELPFKDTYGIGIVVEVNTAFVIVEIDGETLWYYEHELEFTGSREGGR